MFAGKILNILFLLVFLGLFVVACKDKGGGQSSDCERRNGECVEDSTPTPTPTPTPASTPVATPTPTPTPTEKPQTAMPSKPHFNLRDKSVDVIFNINFTMDVDRIEVHDDKGNRVDAVIAVWPSRVRQNIYDLSSATSVSDLFFLAGAERKNIKKIVGFKDNQVVFTAQVNVIANTDTEVTLRTDKFSESGAGIGPYSTRFLFSRHPEKKRIKGPKLETDKALEFVAIDNKGRALWLVNTKDKQARIATGLVTIDFKGDIYAWYRPIGKDCELRQLVFARLENKIFQSICENRIKRQ